MVFDCHVHTRHSGHSEECKIFELKEEALRKGIEISIREHAPFPPEFFDFSRKGSYHYTDGLYANMVALNRRNVRAFFEEVEEAGVSLGFEVDILPGFEEGTERVIEKLQKYAGWHGVKIDAFNCSHHLYKGYSWDASREAFLGVLNYAGGFRNFSSSYFSSIRAAVKSGLYDAVSHIELPMKFIEAGSELENIVEKSKAAYYSKLAETLLCAKSHNVAVEYNTSGIDRACRKPFLSGYALHFAYHMDAPLLIGSDAHKLKDVGRYFDFGVRQLKEYGIHKLHYFKERKMVSYNI
ncbi:MAG: histidinol-phosphatase HisJ family protein [Nanoarchaeota archaeon]|nr:histidinol-phosphatase HisJ family protein [Nanoarchaeota archaeon]